MESNMSIEPIDHSGTTDGFVILQWFFLFLHVCLAGAVLAVLLDAPRGLSAAYRFDISILPGYFIVGSLISLVALIILGACLILRFKWGPGSFSRHFYVVSGINVVLPALAVFIIELLSIAFAYS